MKKMVALVLSLLMALSLCTVAFAAADGDVFYDSMTKDVAKEYTYVDQYTAGPGVKNYLPHFVDGAGNWYKAAASGTAIYDKDLNKTADLYLGSYIADAADIEYDYKADVQKAQTWSCTTDELKAGYVYLDNKDAKHYAVADKEGDLKLLVDGKIVKAKEYAPIEGQHVLYYTGAKMTEVKVGVYQVKCAACGKDVLISKDNINGAGYLYKNEYQTYAEWSRFYQMTASFPANAAIVTGEWYILDAADAVTSGVESAKTFDAGIAMYVGMSLLSVAGGAVVIGKKKEF